MLLENKMFLLNKTFNDLKIYRHMFFIIKVMIVHTTDEKGSLWKCMVLICKSPKIVAINTE